MQASPAESGMEGKINKVLVEKTFRSIFVSMQTTQHTKRTKKQLTNKEGM